MSKPKQGIEIKIERFYFSVRLKSIFFPLDLAELIPILEEVGYAVRSELSQRISDHLPIGVKVMAGGAIAEKHADGQSFRLDPDRGVVSIAGKNIDTIIEDFTNLERLIDRNLNVVLGEEALFYEFQAAGSASTGNDPTEVVARLFQDSKLESEITSVLGVSTTNFGVRVVERDRLVTDTQWFEYKIEPLIPKPKTSYHIEVVYRHSDKLVVEQQAKSLSETIEKLLCVIEQQV